MQRYILYQAYGDEGILLECKFSIMQLLKYSYADSFCIVLYTDNEDFFKPVLRLFKEYKIVNLAPGKIKQWRGDIDFVHRVKIEMLLDFFSIHKGAVIYFDTDTYCKTSIAPLFDDIENGHIVMHTYEGNLGDRKSIVFKKWKRFLNENTISYNVIPITNISKIQMWNAGVLGFSDQYLPQLRDVLKLTDNIYPKFQKHTVEQFAFSYIFQQITAIRPADNIIYHYWDLKEYRKLLIHFFISAQSLSIKEQLEQLRPVMPEIIYHDKMQHKKQPFFKKIFSKKWQVESCYPGISGAPKP